MSTIEKQVMAAVGLIYVGRRLTSAVAVKVYGLLLSFAGIGMFVSLSNVAANLASVMQGGIASVGVFLLSAVMSTTFVVQLALLVGGIAIVSLLRDAVRLLSHQRTLFAR